MLSHCSCVACVQFVTLPNGLKVSWSGKKEVTITTPSSRNGAICGLFGNSNGNAGDDNVMGPATECGVNDPGATVRNTLCTENLPVKNFEKHL